MADFKTDRELQRSRSFTFLIYPESAPNDWLKKVESVCVPSFVSPLHLPDEDNKKPHYHCIFYFDSLKSVRQVEDLLHWLFGSTVIENKTCYIVNFAEIVQSLSSLVRYLIHFDDSKKEQFPPTEADIPPWQEHIITFHYDRTKLDKIFECGGLPSLLTDIIFFINENNIHFFHILVNYALTENKIWAPVIIEYQKFLIAYLKSFSYCQRDFDNKLKVKAASPIPVKADNNTTIFFD